MGNIILVLLLLLSGMGLRQLSAFDRQTPQVLNQYVIHISLPALILVQIPRLEWSMDLLTPVVMPWIMLVFSAGMVLGLARLFRWDSGVTGGLLLTVPLGNTSFLGIPMIQALFGPEWVSLGVLYDQMGSFPALATYGTLVATLYQGRHGGRFEPRAVLIRIVTFPPFMALVTAFLVGSWLPGTFLEPILQRLADTLVPVVMVAVGFQFRPVLPRLWFKPVMVGLGIKMFLAPLVALGLCLLFGQRSPPALIAIFEAGMPPMITAGAVAAAAGLAPELMAAMVGLGILVSLVSLPLWAMVLQAIMG